MIRYIGRINRKEVNELYGSARAGIVIYQPAGNHMEAQPIKLFEFMAAGLPVIASNFPLWKQIVEENGCGFCVDPCSVTEVKNACESLLNDPAGAQVMGQNGRRVIRDEFNWNMQAKKLVDLYEKLERETVG